MPKATSSASLSHRHNKRPSLLEKLESRQMLSVSLNGQGSTIVTPSASDHVIYCSSSTGNDLNSGLSPDQAVQSLSAAVTRMRNHTGDELLFKAGDTWHGNFGYWKLSGASATDPMVIGSYGTGARPTIMTGTNSGIQTGSSSAPEIDYLDIIGIHFWADGRDPSITPNPVVSNPTGMNFLSGTQGMLVENCLVQDYDVNMNFQNYSGPLNNVVVRRNISIDAWSTTTHAQGMYAIGVNNLTIDGNLFDHNGYNTQISGAAATWYNQDCYLSAHNTNVIVINNIFSRAAGAGLQDRPGGVVQNNLFLDNPVGLTYGLVNGASTTVGGVHGSVTGNVFTGSPAPGAMPAGQAIQVANITAKSGTVISNNIFTTSSSSAGAAISLMVGIAQSDPQDSVGINDLAIQNNIFYNWTTGVYFDTGLTPGGTGLTALNNVSMVNNQFENMSRSSVENRSASYLPQETWSGNTYFNAKQIVNGVSVTPIGTVRTTPIAFPSPNNSVASYDGSIGGNASDADFLASARAQSEANWNTSVTAGSVLSYIERGFSVTTRYATTRFAAINFDAQQGGLKSDGYKGLGNATPGAWAEYKNIDFKTGLTKFSAAVARLAGAGAQIELHLDSPTGTLIGTLQVAPTGGWTNYTSEMTTISGASGVHDLYLVFGGTSAAVNVYAFTFV